MTNTNLFRSLIPTVTAASLLALTVFTAPACSGQTPFAPDASAAPAKSVAPMQDGAGSLDAAGQPEPLVTFAAGEASNPSARENGLARSYAASTGNCIRQFYDPSFYNWLAFQNLCNQSIMIDYIPVYPGYGGSSMTLRPGQKGSTGYSRSEVQAKRGYQMYSCPAGYLPVDANNRYVTRINTSFRCLRQ